MVIKHYYGWKTEAFTKTTLHAPNETVYMEIEAQVIRPMHNASMWTFIVFFVKLYFFKQFHVILWMTKDNFEGANANGLKDFIQYI